ncbi:MAG: hypothetical protein F6K62_10530 [Sphaerospermopsis sp. SIO1G2]|nr:hypothetical protein [Sphaerospermopsis sp. SIO1G2]
MSDNPVEMDDVMRTVDSLLQEYRDEGGAPYGSYGDSTGVTEKSAMPQLDASTYSSQIFWLVLCFSALYLLISRSALPVIHEIQEKRRHRIDSDLDRAKRLSHDAQKARDAYEALHRQAKQDASDLMAQASAEIAGQHEEAMERVDADIVRMLGKSDRHIQQQRREMAQNLRPVVAELALDLVEAVAGKTSDAAHVNAVLDI